jgi:CheY-like chemotaxis protein/HPt (histidine-containing phosphotransfer) domain-containing protein
VALNLLAQIGYRADLARNGPEALEALQRQPYDIILMDILMPEIDGFETTRRIREQCPPERQPRIIALTAVVMPGNRERCLAAGMDDYISKPIDIPKLQGALARWGEGGSQADVHPEGIPSTPALTNEFDRLLRLRAMQESTEPDIVTELISLFLEGAAPWLEALSRAAQQADAPAFERAAHSLKGSCASIGAHHMATLCADLEQHGQRGQLVGLAPLLAQLEAEFERVRCELEAQRREA